HVLALVVAADDDAAGARAEELDDGAGVGPAVDEVADADDEVVVADPGAVEQIEQLRVTAVDVADDECVSHGSPPGERRPTARDAARESASAAGFTSTWRAVYTGGEVAARGQ